MGYSIDCSVNSWSHERCITRPVNALSNMHKEDDAQQILLRIQKAYRDAGKMLQSTRRMSPLTPLLDNKVRSKVSFPPEY